ncbi:beta-glucosidase Cel3B [Cellvibrio japonicus]|uniref:Glucan 1,4-beta-glucosidase, putative, cel3B n=1 Tax=Cellvibrio japonicus (strain Ueda107) TaxID=498211 RepID=B3PDN7_CELJU|nr:beta-glucosidase Cel3B [Cellvibrio japonicus]ACE83024.1 glucan 1,4-beta-glucosidase, putative, cel3B [Cellvibrio japonicus Ueda107]QEI12046.1 glycoside hydrolase family 3 protein [Cellvibrio japonicus]QEI15620.1 glycoside hydrolase family 3 protein [Cellvibrio japonicus]QEI19198.1 glycoside hydrolase family 3 protein [Cellvibrio japonicus]
MLWPKVTSKVKKDPILEAKIDQLMARMSLEEKIGQMMQPEIRHLTPEDVKQYHVGSVLNGGGSVPNSNRYSKAADWLAMADAFYAASMDESDGKVAIPIMWGTDAVHGVGNIVGATLFPHNIGLGATQNPELIKEIGKVTATEIAVTGLDWDFSPTVAVARDDRWGRTYESYSEDPAIVRLYAAEMVAGLQGDADTASFLSITQVVATAKHFLGDGGTLNGIDRGDCSASESELLEIHAAGYYSAIEAGVQTVMASFNSWHGQHMHGHRYLLTDVLKEQMGFDGFIVGDWNGHGFVEGASVLNCPQAINAGLDMFMVPDPEWKTLYQNTLDQVRDGIIPLARVDDAVRRILRVKLRADLWGKGLPSSRPLAGRDELLGAAAHRAIARQAVRESLVMLKNKNNLLPLSPKSRVLVAGDGADNISKQTGGWSVNWQGTGNTMEDFPGATTLWMGIKAAVTAAGGDAELSPDGTYSSRPDVALVIFGEDPYAEMQGDIQHQLLKSGDTADLDLLRRLKADGIPVVALFITGRPMWVNRELNAADAFVVIWQPGTEGAGVADVLFARAEGGVNYPMGGRLTFSWPKRPDQGPLNVHDTNYDPLFPYGYGLRYGDKDILGDTLSEEGISMPQSTRVLELFNRRPMGNYVIALEGNRNDRQLMNGNLAKASTLTVTVVDRDVQEDARRAVWNGEGEGLVALSTPNRQVLSDYYESDAALFFDIKVDQAPEQQAFVRIGCGPSCHSDVDVTELLRSLEGKGWASIRVDLACYPEVETNFGLRRLPHELFALILEPFSLVANGKMDISFSRVYIEKNRAQHGTFGVVG